MKKKPSKKPTTIRTRRAIVHLLKQEGALDAQALAARLHLSAMAVRQHLYALRDEHLVTYHEVPRPVGRPAKLWQLTSAADRGLWPAARRTCDPAATRGSARSHAHGRGIHG